MKAYRKSKDWLNALIAEMTNKSVSSRELIDIIYKLDKNVAGDRAKKIASTSQLVRLMDQLLSGVIGEALVINRARSSGGSNKNSFTVNGTSEELLKKVDEYFERRAEEYLHPKPKPCDPRQHTKIYKQSVRDAIVSKAVALEKQNPVLSREESIMVARRSVRKISETDIQQAWDMLTSMDNLGRVVEFSVLKEKLGLGDSTSGTGYVVRLINRIQPYLGNLTFDIQILDSPTDGRSKLIKSTNSNIGACLQRLSVLAKELFGITLRSEATKNNVRAGVVVNRPEFDDLNGILFFIGGIIMHESGKCSTVSKIGRILRGSYYHKVTQSDQKLLSIIQGFPQFFEVVSDKVVLAGKAADTWDRLKLFNPASQEWDIPWCINSDLDIDTIREYFPESFVVNEAACVPGSKIVMVRASKGIKSYNDLCLMSRRMKRGCDYPVVKDVENFMMRLDAEYDRMRKSLDSYMKGLTPTSVGSFSVVTEDFDRILYRIEEEQ